MTVNKRVHDVGGFIGRWLIQQDDHLERDFQDVADADDQHDDDETYNDDNQDIDEEHIDVEHVEINTSFSIFLLSKKSIHFKICFSFIKPDSSG